MNGINKVMLLGTVGSDPEIKNISDTLRVCSFRMATNESFTKNGEKKELTEWHNVEAWNLLADTIMNYVKKGTHIIIQGKIKTDSFDDKDVAGKKVYRTKIVADELNFLPNGKKPEGQSAQPQGQHPQQPQGQYPQQPQGQYPQQPQGQYPQQPQGQYPQQPQGQYPQQPQGQYPQQPQGQYPQQPQGQYPQQPVPQGFAKPINQNYPQQPQGFKQPQPVQPQVQAEQQVATYMSDNQFAASMNISAPDDLPF